MQNNNYVCTNMAAELFSLNSDIFITQRIDLINLENSMSSLEIEYATPQQQQQQQLPSPTPPPPHDEVDTKTIETISSRTISFMQGVTDITHSSSSSPSLSALSLASTSLNTPNSMEHSTESTKSFRINWGRSLRSNHYYNNEYDSDNHDSNSNSNSNQSLHRINRRTILKPKKKTFKIGNTESELKKIYVNQKFTSVRSTCLETIVEENLTNLNDNDNANDNDELVTFIGVRKLKRSLSLSGGATKNKSILQRRKKRIKAAFGNQNFKNKKIPMHLFIDKLKSMHNNTDEDEMEVRMIGTINENKTIITYGENYNAPTTSIVGEQIQFRTFGESKSDPECFFTD